MNVILVHGNVRKKEKKKLKYKQNYQNTFRKSKESLTYYQEYLRSIKDKKLLQKVGKSLEIKLNYPGVFPRYMKPN